MTLEFIQENMSDSELSGDKIATQHHLSRSQFARKLKTLTNKSVTEFIRSQHLTEAKRLLNEGNLNISEIAYGIGFVDPAYFTRVFTKETGVSPFVLEVIIDFNFFHSYSTLLLDNFPKKSWYKPFQSNNFDFFVSN